MIALFYYLLSIDFWINLNPWDWKIRCAIVNAYCCELDVICIQFSPLVLNFCLFFPGFSESFTGKWHKSWLFFSNLYLLLFYNHLKKQFPLLELSSGSSIFLNWVSIFLILSIFLKNYKNFKDFTAPSTIYPEVDFFNQRLFIIHWSILQLTEKAG